MRMRKYGRMRQTGDEDRRGGKEINEEHRLEKMTKRKGRRKRKKRKKKRRKRKKKRRK